MGYETYYSGTIKLFDKKAIEIIKKMMKDEEEPFFDNEIYINDDDENNIYLDIGCNWKDYDDKMLKLCYFVATLDKGCSGEIECKGEESDDIWRITIRKGGIVLRENAIITYDEGSEFKDKTMMKKVYDITKDKKLLKEIIVDSL